MFVLVVVEDKIKIHPEQFEQNVLEVLERQITAKYVNKILTDAGLCICLYDFLEIGDPYIYPAEGSSHHQVKFRLVVFRPFVGEVLNGNVIESNANGLKVSLNFFTDIHIPSHYMQHPSSFDVKSQLWSWKYGDPDSEEVQDFVVPIGSEIRIKVKTIQFTEIKSSAKGVETLTTSETQAKASNLASKSDMELIRKRSSSIGHEIPTVIAPMQIIASISEDGLGLISWWQ